MVKVKDNKVYITRGDTAYLKVNPIGYSLKDGDNIKLQVKDSPDRGNLKFNGTIVKVGSDIVWKIVPANTQTLELGTYFFDVEIDAASGDIYTYISGKLIVQASVTEKAVS